MRQSLCGIATRGKKACTSQQSWQFIKIESLGRNETTHQPQQSVRIASLGSRNDLARIIQQSVRIASLGRNIHIKYAQINKYIYIK